MIDVINENERLERLTNALQAQNDAQARRELQRIKKSLENEKYKLDRKIREDKFKGAQLGAAQARSDELKKDLAQLARQAKVIRKSLDNPKVRINHAVNSINLMLNQRDAEKERIEKINENRKTRGLKRVTLLEVKATEKMQILTQRLIYENQTYLLSENKIDAIQEILSDIPALSNINVKQDIADIFDTSKHFESGDEYDELKDLFNSYAGRMVQEADTMTAEEIEQAENAISALLDGLGG